MDGFWNQIVGQIALSLVMPLVTAAATAIVTWLVWWWQKLFKSEFDAKSRATLHDALSRGMGAAVQSLLARRGYAFVTSETRPLLLSEAASYAEKWSTGTVGRLKLSHADLMELATPHLPMPANLSPASRRPEAG
jgi:hypothetical protein